MRAEPVPKPLIALATLVLAGCVELSPQQLIVREFEPGNRHPYSVSVTVDGPSYGDLARNTNETIRLALEETIREARVFAEVIGAEEGVADYHLQVNVDKILQWGTYTSKTRAILLWELFATGTSEPKWRDSIETSCSEESGPSRARRQTATECAVRSNLSDGIQRLSELELAPILLPAP